MIERIALASVWALGRPAAATRGTRPGDHHGLAAAVCYDPAAMRQPGYFYSQHLGTNLDFVWHGDRGPALILLPTSGGNHLENEDRGLIRALNPGDRCRRGPGDLRREHEQRVLGPQGPAAARSACAVTTSTTASSPTSSSRGCKKHAHHPDVMIYGASMGGFHAVNFAARHPELVKRAIALSGFFDLQRILSNGYWDELCYYHSPVHFVPNMDEEWCAKLSKVEWVIATGEQDSLVEETRRMAWDPPRRRASP